MRGTWGADPPKNHKNIGLLSNTGPDPLKNHKATKPSLLGHYPPASKINSKKVGPLDDVTCQISRL